LAAGRFHYLTDETDLAVHQAAAALLRDAVTTAGFLSHRDKQGSLNAAGPPWFELGLPGEEDVTVVNPHTIQYGVGVHEYLTDSMQLAFASRATGLANLSETLTPSRRTFSLPDDRYRLSVHAGRGGSWDDRIDHY